MNSKNLKKGRIPKKSLPFIAVSVASVGFALSNPVKAADVDVKEDVVATEASEVKVAEAKESVAVKEANEPEIKEKAVTAEVKEEVLPEVNADVKTEKVEAPVSADLQLKSEAVFAAATQENEPVEQAGEPVPGDEFDFNDLKYKIIDKNAINPAVKLSNHDDKKKPTGTVTIPDMVTNPTDSKFYPVEAIGANALLECADITEVQLPKSIKEISENAFKDCSKLVTINLPTDLEKLEDSAFYGCSALTNIKIPEGITEIKSGTFKNCAALSEIQIPENIKTVGASAFEGCAAITKIKIPASVTSIETNAFKDCTSLKYMIIEGKELNLASNALGNTPIGMGTDGAVLYLHKELKENAEFKEHLGLSQDLEAKVLKEIPSEAPSIQNVRHEITGDKIKISWDAPNGSDFRYKVTLKTNGENEEVLEEKLTVTEYETTLPEDKFKIYTYSVVPYVFYNSSAVEEDEYGNMTLEGTAAEVYYGETEIKAPAFEGGSITFDKDKASVGDKITMTVKPNAGYVLIRESLKVNGGAVAIEENENGTYTFVMPDETLKIDAEFKKECPEVKYTDSKTGVILEAPEGTFPEGSHISVEEVGKDHANYALVWNNVDDNIKEVAERCKFYSIEVLDKDGNKVQPQNGNKVKICLPVPEGYDIKDVEAFRIESGDDIHYDSKIELIDGKNYLVFEVDHLSYYGIIDPDMKKVEEITSKNEQNNNSNSSNNSSSNSDKSGKAGSKESGSSGFYKTSDGRLGSILGCIFSSISSGAAYLFSRKSRKRK